MAKPPRRADYRRKLTHPLTLHDGRKLTTLRDGANVLLDVFGAVNARSGVLDHSVRQLLTAAHSGSHADIQAATDALERVLGARRMLANR